MKKRMLLTSLALTGTLIFSGFAIAQQGQQGQQGRQSMQWQQESSQGEGAPLTIAPSTVRQIQLRLNQAGFDPGDVDGTWGKSTSNALANYQRSVGLEPTGQINLNTMHSLGVQYGIGPAFGGGQGQGQGQMQGGQFQQMQPQQQQPQYQQQPRFQQQPQQDFQQQRQYRSGGQQGEGQQGSQFRSE